MIDRLRGLEDSMGPQVEQLKEQALGAAATAREKLAEGTELVRDYTQKQPARALGVALGLGVFLGWLIKRR